MKSYKTAGALLREFQSSLEKRKREFWPLGEIFGSVLPQCLSPPLGILLAMKQSKMNGML